MCSIETHILSYKPQACQHQKPRYSYLTAAIYRKATHDQHPLRLPWQHLPLTYG